MENLWQVLSFMPSPSAAGCSEPRVTHSHQLRKFLALPACRIALEQLPSTLMCHPTPSPLVACPLVSARRSTLHFSDQERHLCTASVQPRGKPSCKALPKLHFHVRCVAGGDEHARDVLGHRTAHVPPIHCIESSAREVMNAPTHLLVDARDVGVCSPTRERQLHDAAAIRRKETICEARPLRQRNEGRGSR